MRRRKISISSRIIFLIIMIVFILMSVFSYYLYKINKDHQATFTESSKFIIKETDLEKLTQQYAFQDEELYHIFRGETKQGEEMIASLRLVKKKDLSKKNIDTYKSEDLVSENAIINHWSETCSQCEMVQVQPAMIDKELLWEIKYNDEDDRYVFAYYSMSDGVEYEQFKLKRNFN